MHPFSIPDRLDPIASVGDANTKESLREKRKPPRHASVKKAPDDQEGSEETPRELDEIV